MALASGQPSGVLGMDVSAWQKLTPSDWSAAYANGARFAYVKATESTDYVSSQFSEQYGDSLSAGLFHGAYHFATPDTSSGAAQANYFVSNGGGWTPDGHTLPPLLDIEYNPYGSECYGLSQADMVAWISSFSSTVLSRTGRLPAIYSTTDWWRTCTGDSTGFSANPLFIASWPSNVAGGPGTLPRGWPSFTFWQYADSGVFPGDQDEFNGNISQLQVTATTQSAWRPSPVVATGDLNGDGRPDLLATKPDGTLWFYPGNGKTTAPFGPGQKIGLSGWNMFSQIVAPGDLNGDGKPDLLGITPTGQLYFYAGTGTTGKTGSGYDISGLAPSINVDWGWNMFTQVIGAGDLNGDGKPDILGITPSGNLYFYSGTGTAGSTARPSGLNPGQNVDFGWNMFTQVVASGDLNGDGKPDILGITPSGNLYYYSGTGTAGSTARPSGLNFGKDVDFGWNIFTYVIGAGDISGDHIPDVLGITPSGDLYSYLGTGTAGQPAISSGLHPGTVLDTTGWNAFTTTLAPGDVNGDGKPDLIGVTPEGHLDLYAGTGSTASSGNAAALGLKPPVDVDFGWNVFNHIVATGDLNGDGRPDLLATKPDGTLWFYPGNGKTTAPFGPGQKIGLSGWNMFSQIVAPGDLNGDGKPDLLGITPTGQLYFYAGTGTTGKTGSGYDISGLAPSINVDWGWNMFTQVIGAGDLNGDGKPDILGITPSGNLYFYSGTGTAGSTARPSGLNPGQNVDFGWNMFTQVVASGDLNGDGKPDILGITPSGNLYYYSGTGTAGSTARPSGLNFGKDVDFGWNIFG
ncbi:FG-GAP-like repeat-containing protein [Planctomonas sp. JC2975]|uniref:FG-GAP-like repeat-containing protein n=1 Tax=Planctomonas sp. JC2975 TaxID=2729626 RepID=UPI001F10FA6E|nr:FG-GAP-like repeat-containing protein [Planctomonas sp. JC2975]